MHQNFPKEERLKSLKKIQQVIKEGRVVRFGTIKICWMIITAEQEQSKSPIPQIKAGFSVPKKKIKRAVDRNQVRRKIKEIFRLHKAPFYSIIPKGQQLILFFIYQNNEILSYKKIETDLLPAIKRIQDSITKQQNKNQTKF